MLAIRKTLLFFFNTRAEFTPIHYAQPMISQGHPHLTHLFLPRVFDYLYWPTIRSTQKSRNAAGYLDAVMKETVVFGLFYYGIFCRFNQ
jgi:hypothetical protein